MTPQASGSSGGDSTQPLYGVQKVAWVRSAPRSSSGAARPSRSIVGVALGSIWCVQTTL